MNYRIEHKDIADLGYYFLDQKHEEKYLESLNDELSLRVGLEVMNRFSEKKYKALSSVEIEELIDYLKENNPQIDRLVIRVREKYLHEIRKKRRFILQGE